MWCAASGLESTCTLASTRLTLSIVFPPTGRKKGKSPQDQQWTHSMQSWNIKSN